MIRSATSPPRFAPFDDREEDGPDASFPVAGGSYRVGLVRPAMGTLVSVVVVHSSGAEAEDAIEEAFSEMGRLVRILDRHDASSPLAQLNATGRLRHAPPELAEVLGRALRYHRLTRGAFDVTVKPVMDLLDGGGDEPSARELARVGELIGAEKLALCGRDVRFGRSGMGVTLDGIAKGFIVDRMAAALAARGIRRFLINAGGDVRAAGGRGNGHPWRIGVRDPANPHGLCDVLEIATGAVATSGNYLRRVRHIVDAATGRPAEGSASVSVTAPEAMAADALATALFVLGPGAGEGLARSVPGCECLVLDPGGRSVRSLGWPGAGRRQVSHE
jgi:thiamine biosynthesis lipoprotein